VKSPCVFREIHWRKVAISRTFSMERESCRSHGFRDPSGRYEVCGLRSWSQMESEQSIFPDDAQIAGRRNTPFRTVEDYRNRCVGPLELG
jgi:hypothetical protein